MIKPIDSENIHQAVSLAERVFPTDVPTPEESFMASLYPDRFKLVWKHYNITYLKYWALFSQYAEVIGTVGIYSIESDDITADWVGWLCVKDGHQRHGFGTDLMEFVLRKMRNRGKRTAKLYTESIATSATALYRKLGFYKTGIGTDPGGAKILYFEKQLEEI